MSLNELIAFIGGGVFVAAGFLVARFGDKLGGVRLSALMAINVVFAVVSILAIVQEGLLGFWPIHAAQGWWGNQVWFDLLMAAGLAFSLLVPRLRSVGLNPVLLFFFVVATGSLGLYAVAAALLYMEGRQSRRPL